MKWHRDYQKSFSLFVIISSFFFFFFYGLYVNSVGWFKKDTPTTFKKKKKKKKKKIKWVMSWKAMPTNLIQLLLYIIVDMSTSKEKEKTMPPWNPNNFIRGPLESLMYRTGFNLWKVWLVEIASKLSRIKAFNNNI